jgi:hypothetical protein
MAGRVYVANTSFSVEFEGKPLVVEAGRTAREGHGLLVAYPQFFNEIVPDFEHTPPPPPPPPAPKPPAATPPPAPKLTAPKKTDDG